MEHSLGIRRGRERAALRRTGGELDRYHVRRFDEDLGASPTPRKSSDYRLNPKGENTQDSSLGWDSSHPTWTGLQGDYRGIHLLSGGDAGPSLKSFLTGRCEPGRGALSYVGLSPRWLTQRPTFRSSACVSAAECTGPWPRCTVGSGG